jgi:hypothetical protein
MKDKPLGYNWSNVNPALYHNKMSEELFKKSFNDNLPAIPPSYPRCKLSDIEIDSTLEAVQSTVAYIAGRVNNKCNQAVFADLEETFFDGQGKVLFTRISRYDTSIVNSTLENNHLQPGYTELKFNLPVLVQAKSIKIKAVSLGQRYEETEATKKAASEAWKSHYYQEAIDGTFNMVIHNQRNVTTMKTESGETWVLDDFQGGLSTENATKSGAYPCTIECGGGRKWLRSGNRWLISRGRLAHYPARLPWHPES